ncbi:orotidine-5'-phosphate decarboxylase [Balneolales bacterium ANBcel1]|nr:orotidine-5'-phosphate decarboxylase [Balneolales bacterium ANBcel1]
MTYSEKILNAVRGSRSVLCAGIDPVPEQFPPVIRNSGQPEREMAATFCRTLITQTKAHVAAYKINTAYFEALGPDAFHVLNDVLDAIPSGKIIIADIKRGDVPHTNARYKTAFFDRFGFDAVTLSPFMGLDTMLPFLQDTERAVYALTLTSNPGASDFMTQPFGGRPTLSEYVADQLQKLSETCPGTLGMVIGATQSDLYKPVMRAFSGAPLLIPGVGAQGGSVEELSAALQRHRGVPLINVSRSLSAFNADAPEPWDLQIALNAGRLNGTLEAIAAPHIHPADNS